MRITLKSKGDYKHAKKWLNNARDKDVTSILKSYGDKGVNALSQATPVDTGEAANSWDYVVESNSRGYKLIFTNSKMVGRVPLVILLQYGHGTRGGTWVQGRDFINPAMAGIMESLATELWKEVIDG